MAVVGERLTETSAAGAMVMVKLLASEAPAELVAITEKVAPETVAVGVPEMTPFALKASPAGRLEPLANAQVMVPPPVAVRVAPG